jgi:hypothetical protein
VPQVFPPVSSKNLTGKTLHLRQALDQYPVLIEENNLTQFFSARKKSEFFVMRDDGIDLTLMMTSNGTSAELQGLQYAREGYRYNLKKEQLGLILYTGTGIDYGMLVVPFKYQFSDHSISGSTTVGAYLGYTVNWLDFASLTPLISFGLSPLTVQSAAGSANNTSVLGLSGAVGVAFTINKFDSSMQGGVVCGQDTAGNSTPTPYKYEGQWWCAAQIGFPFTQ